MATVRPVVLPHQQKKDGTWNVKIIVTHNRNKGYIETQHYVVQKQLRKNYEIRDQFILSTLNPVLDGYRRKISELGEKLNFHTAKSLTDLLKNGEVKAETINFIAFGWNVAELIKGKSRKGCLGNIKAVMYGLQDFFKSDKVPITEITSKMLGKYEVHLRTPRTMMRPNQFGKITPRYSKGVTDGGLHNHMRDLRTIFKDAVKFYNNKEQGIEIIKHYPFENYKIVDSPESNKPKLTVAQVKKIRDVKVLTKEEVKAHKQAIRENPQYEMKGLVYVLRDSREHQAGELAMLSFYMCGMNAVDLYQLAPADGHAIYRLDYNRAKTKGRRKDNAFISLNIPDVALPLYLKYAGQLQLRYSSSDTLNQALSRGIKPLGEKLGILDLEFYDLRHAFADQARNVCGVSKDDVGAALNHKDNTNSVTDKYISKSWKIVDKVQRDVISLYIDRLPDHSFCNQSPFLLKRVDLGKGID
jgi:integrase